MIGKFLAKVSDYGVTPPSANSGIPQAWVKFAFQDQGANKELTYYGSFAGGALDFTLKSLINCGFTQFNQLGALMNGVGSNLLDTNRDVEIDVQEEAKQDGNGMRTVIKWVNDPAAAPATKKIDQATNAQYFGTNNFEGDLVRLAQEMGLVQGGAQGNSQRQGDTGNGQNSYNNNNQNNNQNNNFNNNGQNNNQNNNNQNQNQNQNQNNNQNNYQNNQSNNNNQNNNNNFNAPF